MSEDIKGLDDEPQYINIKNGEKIVNMPKEYILLSNVWKTALENDSETREIESELDRQTFDNIIAYLELRKGIDISIGLSYLENLPPKDRQRAKNDHKYSNIVNSKILNNIPPLEKDFIDSISKGPELNNLFSAANSLGIYSLLHLCAMKIASIIRGVPENSIVKLLTEKN